MQMWIFENVKNDVPDGIVGYSDILTRKVDIRHYL
jgi:hypothetical protein